MRIPFLLVVMVLVIGLTASCPAPIWTARWENEAVVPGSVRQVSANDGKKYFQSMMHPDGTRVVFWGGTGNPNWDVYVANVEGTNLRNVTGDMKRNSEPFWTPDGRIVFGSNRSQEGGNRIWIMDAEGGNLQQITSGAGVFADGRPCVSPDLTTVVFERWTSGVSKPYRTPLAGGAAGKITVHNKSDRRPAFSPDGKKLAYWTTNSTGSNIAVMDWPNGAPVLIAPENPVPQLRGPWWRQDGVRIACHGTLNGVDGLRMINIQTGQVTPINIPGFSKPGHISWDKAEKFITFDGPQDLPHAQGPFGPDE